MALTLGEIEDSLFKSVFQVIRSAVINVPKKDFLKKTVQEVVPSDPSPTGWPGFWREVLAEAIQDEFSRYDLFVDHFDEKWFNNQQKTMKELRNFVDDNLKPLP